MSRARLLYIDVPFEHEAGGDKNRSRFLWNTLREAFDVDCLLVVPPGSAGDRPRFTTVIPLLELTPRKGPWYQSDSVYSFEPDEQAKFLRLLTEQRYDAVLIRFQSAWQLACAAAKHPTRPAVIVDLDMLSSRLVGLRWRLEPSWKNRWFLFETVKLDRFEDRLLDQPFLVLFSNPVELVKLRDRRPRPVGSARLAVLPNVMPPWANPTGVTVRPVILFFGSLNSAANTDAFRFLVESLLPQMERDLRRQGVQIEVVGKNPPVWFSEILQHSGTDRIVLVGGVESMERALAECRFVLLPLRVASGTRTRILEAASAGRAVVTTKLGAEGIEVGEDALVADTPEELAAAVRSLLEDPMRADVLGQWLRDRCQARYSVDRVAGDLVREVSGFIADRKGRGP